jgi:ribosomal protein L3 glutamine methyltransferase
MTQLADLIQQTAQRFEAAGISLGQGTLDYTDEAAWLLLWAAGLPLDTDWRTQELPELDAANLARIEALVGKRITSRQPTAYLTGEAWLQGLPFYVDQRCIIPRSLIAEIIADGSADAWLDPQAAHALDLCTGNGSLAVLAAMAWPELHISASDLSANALAVARINIDKHGLQDRIQLLQGEGLAPAIAQGLRFDLLLCNPPYVNSSSMAALPAEFQAEPDLALAGGQDGMDFVRPLLAQLPQVLTENGVLILEIGHERAFFEAAFPQLAPVWLDTSAGGDQVLLLTREMLMI